MNRKGAEGMSWLLVMMIVAIVGGLLLIFILRGSFSKSSGSIEVIQKGIDRDSQCKGIFMVDTNNNGYDDNKKWDSNGDGKLDECCDPDAKPVSDTRCAVK